MAAADSALRRERESLWIPAPRPSQRRIFPLPRRDPQAASAPFPRGSTSQPRAAAARHLAPLARTPRTVKTGGSVHRGPRSPAPPGRDLSAWLQPQQRRDFPRPPTPLPPRSPFRPEASGRQGRKGLEWSRRPGSPSHGLSTRVRAPSRTLAGGTRRPPLGGLVPRPRDWTGASASSQAGPGGGAWRAGPGGSSPLRGPSRPLAGPANHRGPMTSRPDPSRPGPRETTEGETVAALLLSPPPQQQQQLPGSTETPAHLSFPQRPALRENT